MKGGIIKTWLVTGGLLCAASQVALGVDITIWDGVGAGGGWYGGQENDEVEPNCVGNQSWDLESFDLTGTTLRLTGGWNFLGGYDHNASDDIFIEVDGDAVFGEDRFSGSGNGNLVDRNVYGYDYVIHFTNRGDQNLGAGNYAVYQLGANSTLLTPYYRQNDASGPWVYNDGGELIRDGDIVYVPDQLDGGLYSMEINVGFLGADVSGALFKFTMECGNDNLIGQERVTVPDGGVTATLLGMGLIGMAAIKRRLQS